MPCPAEWDIMSIYLRIQERCHTCAGFVNTGTACLQISDFMHFRQGRAMTERTKTPDNATAAKAELANRLFFRLYQCANMLHKTGTRAIERYGLTTQQWAVLGALSRPAAASGMNGRPGPLPHGEPAEPLGCAWTDGA
jgi:hypothetical protein